MKKRILPFVILFLVSALPRSGSADNLFGEFQRLPDVIERGFSVGADFGLLFFTGETDGIRTPGFQLTFTTGYDFMKYLSVEGVYVLGINELVPSVTFPTGGAINLFQFYLAAKGAYPLGRLHPFFEVGPGIFYADPALPGGNQKFSLLFSGGVEYYTLLRHYSLYLKTTYYYIDLPVDQIAVAIGIKYTF